MALVGEFIVWGDRRVLARVCLLLGDTHRRRRWDRLRLPQLETDR